MLATTVLSLINQWFFTSSQAKKEEFESGILKINNKTLIIANSVYQISNISFFSLVDLSFTRPMPKHIWILAAIIVFLWLFPSSLPGAYIIAFFMFIFDLFLLVRYLYSKQVAKFNLSIQLNSGHQIFILSPDLNFLKRLRLILSEIIEAQKSQNFTINLDDRTIIDGVSGSIINTGKVVGDLVNN